MASCPEAACTILESFFGRIYHRTGKGKKVAEDKKKNVTVGDLVLEIDPNSDSGSWSMAVIKEVLPSEDGLVRKVVVTTNGKDYMRPITQLAPLEYNIS